MSLRKAYELVIRNELDIMVEERGMNIPSERLDSLAVEMADNYDFLQSISDTVENYLEDFGDNHELYDLFD
ncbi:hypothetical protein [Bacillus smithii]|uniref:hypothetical protein n=1 Tax=Bacillus smithii TaxID=1479 RepID=UPI003D1BEF21